MAADLSVHIKTDEVTQRDLEIFFSNTLGSKYCHFPYFPRLDPGEESKARDVISKSPQVWIGEVSWLKAGLLEDSDTFVPNAVAKISEYVGENLPVLTDELIDKIVGALSSKNKTSYEIAEPDEVRKFLEEHKGKQIFAVSW